MPASQTQTRSQDACSGEGVCAVNIGLNHPPPLLASSESSDAAEAAHLQLATAFSPAVLVDGIMSGPEEEDGDVDASYHSDDSNHAYKDTRYLMPGHGVGHGAGLVDDIIPETQLPSASPASPVKRILTSTAAAGRFSPRYKVKTKAKGTSTGRIRATWEEEVAAATEAANAVRRRQKKFTAKAANRFFQLRKKLGSRAARLVVEKSDSDEEDFVTGKATPTEATRRVASSKAKRKHNANRITAAKVQTPCVKEPQRSTLTTTAWEKGVPSDKQHQPLLQRPQQAKHNQPTRKEPKRRQVTLLDSGFGGRPSARSRTATHVRATKSASAQASVHALSLSLSPMSPSSSTSSSATTPAAGTVSSLPSSPLPQVRSAIRGLTAAQLGDGMDSVFVTSHHQSLRTIRRRSKPVRLDLQLTQQFGTPSSSNASDNESGSGEEGCSSSSSTTTTTTAQGTSFKHVLNPQSKTTAQAGLWQSGLGDCAANSATITQQRKRKTLKLRCGGADAESEDDFQSGAATVSHRGPAAVLARTLSDTIDEMEPPSDQFHKGKEQRRDGSGDEQEDNDGDNDEAPITFSFARAHGGNASGGKSGNGNVGKGEPESSESDADASDDEGDERGDEDGHGSGNSNDRCIDVDVQDGGGERGEKGVQTHVQILTPTIATNTASLSWTKGHTGKLDIAPAPATTTYSTTPRITHATPTSSSLRKPAYATLHDSPFHTTVSAANTTPLTGSSAFPNHALPPFAFYTHPIFPDVLLMVTIDGHMFQHFNRCLAQDTQAYFTPTLNTSLIRSVKLPLSRLRNVSVHMKTVGHECRAYILDPSNTLFGSPGVIDTKPHARTKQLPTTPTLTTSGNTAPVGAVGGGSSGHGGNGSGALSSSKISISSKPKFACEASPPAPRRGFKDAIPMFVNSVLGLKQLVESAQAERAAASVRRAIALATDNRICSSVWGSDFLAALRQFPVLKCDEGVRSTAMCTACRRTTANEALLCLKLYECEPVTFHGYTSSPSSSTTSTNNGTPLKRVTQRRLAGPTATKALKAVDKPTATPSPMATTTADSSLQPHADRAMKSTPSTPALPSSMVQLHQQHGAGSAESLCSSNPPSTTAIDGDTPQQDTQGSPSTHSGSGTHQKRPKRELPLAATSTAILSMPQRDTETQSSVSDFSGISPNAMFIVGTTCCKRAKLYHQLYHFETHLLWEHRDPNEPLGARSTSISSDQYHRVFLKLSGLLQQARGFRSKTA
eukprot:m.305003 g.305003  ORF g.305003 m.305003 type:complete len:1238 (+) comp15904_c0_seq21:303-4016(+)